MISNMGILSGEGVPPRNHRSRLASLEHPVFSRLAGKIPATVKASYLTIIGTSVIQTGVSSSLVINGRERDPERFEIVSRIDRTDRFRSERQLVHATKNMRPRVAGRMPAI